ncbi:hypothetical protein V8061_001571 [Vibrio parahaemolyticus]
MNQVIMLTGGNIRNSHMYLTGFMDQLPKSTVGGKNRSLIAPELLTIEFAGVGSVTTDIDGTKRIFRERAIQKQFFEKHSLEEGDQVRITSINDFSYRVSVV